jgi:hypothetical protein
MHTDRWEEFMEYAVEMGSGAMIYIPSFIKIGQRIQKLVGGINRENGDHISLISFLQNRESRLKHNVPASA